MKKTKNSAAHENQQKMGKFRRLITLVSGSLKLYKAVKNKSLRKGIGAGIRLIHGVRG